MANLCPFLFGVPLDLVIWECSSSANLSEYSCAQNFNNDTVNMSFLLHSRHNNGRNRSALGLRSPFRQFYFFSNPSPFLLFLTFLFLYHLGNSFPDPFFHPREFGTGHTYGIMLLFLESWLLVQHRGCFDPILEIQRNKSTIFLQLLSVVWQRCDFYVIRFN